MKNISRLHDEAMEKADHAVSAKMRGDHASSLSFFKAAYDLEKEAALTAVLHL